MADHRPRSQKSDNGGIMNPATFSALSISAIFSSINDILVKTTADVVLVEGNVQSIMGMPDFDLTQITFSAEDTHIVQDFPRDQALSRNVITTAQTNQNTPDAEQALSISSAIGFCNTWNAYLPGLLLSLQESKIDVFTQGMLNLQKHIDDDLVARVDAHITAIDEYKTAAETAVKALSVDQGVFRKYFDTSGAPLDVEKDVNEIQNKMASDNATTARGASVQGLGVLIITLVIVAKIFSEGEDGEEAPDDDAGDKLIDYSVDIIKDDIKEQSEASIDWSANFAKYRALIEKLEYDKQIYVAVSHFVSKMTFLIEYLEESEADLTDINQQWKALASLLASISSEVTRYDGSDTSAFVADLTTLNDSLVALKGQLLTLQGLGKVQVVNFK